MKQTSVPPLTASTYKLYSRFGPLCVADSSKEKSAPCGRIEHWRSLPSRISIDLFSRRFSRSKRYFRACRRSTDRKLMGLTNDPDRVKTLRRVAFDSIRFRKAVAISGRRMTDRQFRE